MKELNCDSIKNISVSDKALKKALSIPVNHKKTSVPFYMMPRVLAAVVCLSLAIMIGTALLIDMSNCVPASRSTDEEVALEDVIRGIFKDSYSKDDIIKYLNRFAASENDTETNKPSQNTVNQSESINNPDDMTLPHTVPPTTIVTDLNKVAEQNEEPTAADISEEQTLAPIEPETEPEAVPPYPWLEYNPESYFCDAYCNLLNYPNNVKVYCKLMSLDRETVYGDSDPFSEQHLAVMREMPGTNKIYVTYIPGRHDILPCSGYYYYEFYADCHKRRVTGGTKYFSIDYMPYEIPPMPEYTPDPPKPIEYKDTCFAYSTRNKVYCKILDADGNVLGDPDLFSDEHIADATLIGSNYYLTYTPKDHGILPEPGLYYYEFYDNYYHVNDGFIYGEQMYFNN